LWYFKKFRQAIGAEPDEHPEDPAFYHQVPTGYAGDDIGKKPT